MPSTPLKIYQDPFQDDCFWDGGNAVTDLVEDVNYDSLAFGVGKQEQPMANIQALRLEEITYDTDSGDETESVAAESIISSPQDSADDTFPFLSLPFEIRQEVYRWLHLMGPVKLTEPMPWYPAPVHSVYVHKEIREDTGPLQLFNNPEALNLLNLLMGTPVTEADLPSPPPAPTRTLLSSQRPFCSLPVSLLQTSKQIYYECRELPFLENEFAFVNWYTSGLWTARSVIKALHPWQAASMRWVRLELLSRDISGAFAPEWEELCGWWAHGLQGLRLKITCGSDAPGPWTTEDTPKKSAGIAGARDEDGRPQQWVSHGLALLRGLRCLEVELVVAEWDNQTKMEWCGELEEVLNESRNGVDDHPVRVVCVERGE